MRKTRPTFVLLATMAMALSACSGDKSPDDASTGAAQALAPGSKTVPDALDDAAGMQTMAEALKETGLAGIFKGKGSYTLLAPEDAAFEQLGTKARELTGSSDHAALAALLKNHLIPGYMTPQDISAAIDASGNGQVSMPTVGGDKLTFTKANGAITVTAPDGSQASVDGEPIAGGSSLAIPVNGILRKI